MNRSTRIRMMSPHPLPPSRRYRPIRMGPTKLERVMKRVITVSVIVGVGCFAAYAVYGFLFWN